MITINTPLFDLLLIPKRKIESPKFTIHELDVSRTGILHNKHLTRIVIEVMIIQHNMYSDLKNYPGCEVVLFGNPSKRTIIELFRE